MDEVRHQDNQGQKQCKESLTEGTQKGDSSGETSQGEHSGTIENRLEEIARQFGLLLEVTYQLSVLVNAQSTILSRMVQLMEPPGDKQ